MSSEHRSFRRIAFALIVTLMAVTTSFAAEVVLDDGATPTLQDHTPHGHWMMHREILGGERERVSRADGWSLTWDGIDNAPGSLDATGLGGIDLTAGAAADRLVLQWPTGTAPMGGSLLLELWSHENLRSAASIELNELYAGRVEVPFTRFTGEADPRDVGALRLTWRAVAPGSLVVPGTRETPRLSLGLIAAPPSQAKPTKRGSTVVRSARLVLAEGDIPTGGGGNAVISISGPFTNAVGDVGFTGAVDNGGSFDRFVFIGSEIVQLNSAQAGFTLSGAEGTMGISDSGGFIYSPSIDGSDGVWSQNGLVAIEETQAPGFPSGTNSTFHSRPTMIPGGQAYWIAGFNETGGTANEGRMLYTSADATADSVAVVLRSDDLIVDDLAIARSPGVDFDFDFSDSGGHHIHVLNLDTGSTSDDAVIWVDGTVIAQEATATGDGDNWDNFDGVAINDDGDFVFSGDTDGDSTTDEFIAYNGVIALRQGDVVDGATLEGSVLFISIDNDGNAFFAWDEEHAFYSCDASRLAALSTRVLSIGDMVDLDGDGSGDATVTDLNAALGVGPLNPIGANGKLYVEVDLDQGNGDFEAMLELDVPECIGIFLDGFESGERPPGPKSDLEAIRRRRT